VLRLPAAPAESRTKVVAFVDNDLRSGPATAMLFAFTAGMQVR
jgi:hypothetical protein